MDLSLADLSQVQKRKLAWRRLITNYCSSSKQKISFLFSLNQIVLFLYIVLTIDHNYEIEYCLKSVVKEIWKQGRTVGTKGIKLLHDNARTHIYSDAINYLTEEGINIIAQPAYSPDRCTV